MDYRDLETKIKFDIENIFSNILKNHNYILPIRSNSRSGAEISDILENDFVSYCKQYPNNKILNPMCSPKGKTKNPFDFCFDYYSNEHRYKDLIWCDIKTFNALYKNSNPNLGTPRKIFDFINDGHFYLLFVNFIYEPTEDNQIAFKPFENGNYVKCQFLKDIKQFWINGLPQIQFNIKDESTYRTFEEFLDYFHQEYSKGIKRNLDKFSKLDKDCDLTFVTLKEKIYEYRSYTTIN